MAYIKIFNKKLMPIGVVSTSNIEVVEDGERYVIVKNEKLIPVGAVNIDANVYGNLSTRLVTVYNDKMLPIGVADIGTIAPNYYESAQIGDLGDGGNEGGGGTPTKKGSVE